MSSKSKPPLPLIVGRENAPGLVRAPISPRETAPDGTRRWRRPLRLGLRRWQPAGPRRLRCWACYKALNKRTRMKLREPGLVEGKVMPAGADICNKHTVHPAVPCPRCSHALYREPGATYADGTLGNDVAYLNARGEAVVECPYCWARLSRKNNSQAELAARVLAHQQKEEE